LYSTCLFCLGKLGENSEIEIFPIGGRLAFDSVKGRLWVVCRKCERWNLVPIEQRWEAVEACEQLFRSTRARYSTENIGIARAASGLQLVRIGRPLRKEFAYWRYGDQFGRRRRSRVTRTMLGGVGAAAFLATGGVAGVSIGSLCIGTAWLGPRLLVAIDYFAGFRIVNALMSGDEFMFIRHRHLKSIVIQKDDTKGTDGWMLVGDSSDGEWEVRGDQALAAAHLFLPAINSRAARKRTIGEAVATLDAMTTPTQLFPHVLKHSASLHLERLSHPILLGLEMAAAEHEEREALENELAKLETAWRHAEEVAAIADNLGSGHELDRKLHELRHRKPS
jgi:hypothetical protein